MLVEEKLIGRRNSFCKTRRGERKMVSRTKEKLAEAFKAVVCRKTFSKTTISDITTECGMTRENFYYHFRDKYDILDWVFQNQLLIQDTESVQKMTMEEITLHFIHNINKDYKFYRAIVKDIGPDQIRKEVFPYIEGTTRKFVEDSMDKNIWKMREEKEHFAVEYFTDAFISFITNYLLGHKEMDGKMMVTNFHFLYTQFFG